MTTARTKSVELQTVSLNNETIPRCHFLLKSLNFAVLELHDLAAVYTNEVVMMALMGDIIELCLVSKVLSFSQSSAT